MNDTSSKSAPRAMRLEPSTNGVWLLVASGSPGHYLHLQRATNLLWPDWAVLATQAVTSPAIFFQDSNHFPQAFYRLGMD